MAKKIEFQPEYKDNLKTKYNIPGYLEGDLVVAKDYDLHSEDTQEPIEGKDWTVYHLKTGCRVSANQTWKQKKQALAYALELQNHQLNFNFATEEELWQTNNRENVAKAIQFANNKAEEV